MNRIPDHDQLLADVLSEASPADLRTTWLNETLRLAARKRRVRRLRGGAAVFLGLVGLAGIIQWMSVPAKSGSALHKAESFSVVHTQPLPAGLITATRVLPQELRVTTAAGVQIVRTDPRNKGFRLLTDQELLAILTSRGAVLVHPRSGGAELIFANPEDQKGFPID